MLVAREIHQIRARNALTAILRHSLNTPTHTLIRAHIATIVRFSTECPIDHIRQHFSDFLLEIRPVRTTNHYDLSFHQGIA